MTTKLFWLAYFDGGFLGVCLVEVDEDDAEDARGIVEQRFGTRAEDTWWIAAACRKAHLMECNPGGEVLTFEVPPDYPLPADLPRNRLLRRPELQQWRVELPHDQPDPA